MKRYIETPWGPSQSQHEHAPGIVFHSTASHGGYHLSSERDKEFCEIKEFSSWTEWLEEDCDACLVYLRWPELATNEQIHAAVTMARLVASWEAEGMARIASWDHPKWITFVNDWLDKLEQPTQQSILIRAQQHANDVAHLWERGSMGSTRERGIWWVSFRRGDERREIHMEYPSKRYYTDKELNELARPEKAGAQ